MKLERLAGRWTGRPKVFLLAVLASYLIAALLIVWALWRWAHYPS
jgi:hypothetical protein